MLRWRRGGRVMKTGGPMVGPWGVQGCAAAMDSRGGSESGRTCCSSHSRSCCSCRTCSAQHCGQHWVFGDLSSCGWKEVGS